MSVSNVTSGAASYSISGQIVSAAVGLGLAIPPAAQGPLIVVLGAIAHWVVLLLADRKAALAEAASDVGVVIPGQVSQNPELTIQSAPVASVAPVNTIYTPVSQVVTGSN